MVDDLGEQLAPFDALHRDVTDQFEKRESVYRLQLLSLVVLFGR